MNMDFIKGFSVGIVILILFAFPLVKPNEVAGDPFTVTSTDAPFHPSP